MWRVSWPMLEFDAVIFDLGGVITHPQNPDKLDELASLLASPLDRESFRRAYSEPRRDYDRGIIGSDEYWRRVAASGSPLAEAASSTWRQLLPRLTRVDIEGWFDIRPAMIDLIGRLKTEVAHVALLSNINRECADHLDAHFNWLDLFDVVVYSCDHRLLKPERAIFDLCLSKLGRPKGPCLFIDDLEENVEGARAAGLRAIRFVDEEGLVEALGLS